MLCYCLEITRLIDNAIERAKAVPRSRALERVKRHSENTKTSPLSKIPSSPASSLFHSEEALESNDSGPPTSRKSFPYPHW